MFHHYCERHGLGLLDEPLNLTTNISFFLAAAAAAHLMKKHGRLNSGNAILVILMILIGTGSTLYHSFASKWAEVSDVVPIFLYQIAFLWLYCQKIIKLTQVYSFLGIFLFIAINVFSCNFQSVLNGSIMYFPAFIVVFSLGVYHLMHQQIERLAILAASLVFSLSLLFRTIDLYICPLWPLGTHFIWHILNGLLLYLTTRVIILAGNEPPH
ncbi:MAG: hypothetical protein FDX30_06145 [Chlorobium sp.]|nr:MAG: hypothetical protein FDX30_06145 [Chlorobium sp.]